MSRVVRWTVARMGSIFIEGLPEVVWSFSPMAGFLALEIGNGQAPDIIGLLTEAGFGDVESIDDYSGTARVVVASRPAGGCRVLKTVQCRGGR